MQVTLMRHTVDAEDILIFSKKTRHMTSIDSYDNVVNMSKDEKEQELDYVFNTIGSSWEFVDYIFLIEGVTRAFTHQLVRHRVGVAFAQQAQRVAKMENFNFLIPPKFNSLQNASYKECMKEIQWHYDELLDMEADPQDARGVLPTNILTNILCKINLRALSEMGHIRLCIRAQGEFQNVALEMSKKAIEVHPWIKQIIGPRCLVSGCCAFPKYAQCPIKIANPRLQPMPEDERNNIENSWKALVGNYDPQPDVNKSWTK